MLQSKKREPSPKDARKKTLHQETYCLKLMNILENICILFYGNKRMHCCYLVAQGSCWHKGEQVRWVLKGALCFWLVAADR
jgi:hypothetical protein